MLGFTTLLLISVFFLDRAHGTHRWFHVGPISLQPSELAKPALILFLAWFLENKTKAHGRLAQYADSRSRADRGFSRADCFSARPRHCHRLRRHYRLRSVCCGDPAALFRIRLCRGSLLPLYFLIFHVSYRRDRILAFLNPYADPKGFGFHIIQSLIAVSTGGVTGLGLMEGKQKLFYLPEPHTDFIFAVTAEELGLVGALAVIILFAIFLWRGTRAALRTQDNFGRFLAVGITSMIVLQAFINISVVLGLMPTKGIPLPFVSYGGSSLFVTLACVGVLLNITKQAE